MKFVHFALYKIKPIMVSSIWNVILNDAVKPNCDTTSGTKTIVLDKFLTTLETMRFSIVALTTTTTTTKATKVKRESEINGGRKIHMPKERLREMKKNYRDREYFKLPPKLWAAG